VEYSQLTSLDSSSWNYSVFGFLRELHASSFRYITLTTKRQGSLILNLRSAAPDGTGNGSTQAESEIRFQTNPGSKMSREPAFDTTDASVVERLKEET
jgi:hypothetical protein